ncbi:MAG: HEPN domain-containing protein [Bacillota bacterium]
MTEQHKVLSNHRLDKSLSDLETAEILMEHDKFNQALNRSYYSIFHAMRAVLALDGFDSPRHSGVISEFNMRYIKTEIFDRKYGRIIKLSEMLRNESDYKDIFIADIQQAREQVGIAREFYDLIREFLLNK